MALTLAPRPPDLNQCEAELIHIPGAIQPHGCLLALHGPARRITQASANTQAMLGIKAADLLGCELAATLGPALGGALDEALARYEELPGAPAAFGWQAPTCGPCTGYVHQCDDLTVLELEPAPGAPAALGTLLTQAVRGSSVIHAQRELPAKLQSATDLFKRLTGYDRVMIYRFDEDWHGEVVAEARRADLEPYLGLHYPASDIPAQARRLYLISHTRVIVDVDYAPSPLLPGVNAVTGRPLDLSRSLLRSVSPVHLEYLRNMGVRASLTVPLLCDGALWGLIACHHGAPRPVSDAVRELADWLGRDLTPQIARAQEISTRQYEAQLAGCRNRVIEALRGGTRLADLLAGPHLSDVLGTVGATGVALINGGGVTTGGLTPAPPQVLAIAEGLATLHQDGQPQVFATDCLNAHLPGTADLAGSAAGVAAFPLDPTQPIRLLWFRGEQIREVSWGGNPDRAMARNPDGRLSPRRSFAAWSQSVRLHSRRWHPAELESVRTLGALIDIEWRRVAEEALREKEALLNDVLDSLTAHLAVLNRDGVITLVNAAWRRFAVQNGGSMDCLPGADYLQVCRQVLSGQDGMEATAALRGIQQVLDQEQGAFSLVYPCDSPTQARWFEMRVWPLRGPRPGVVIAHEEITGHRLAAQAQRASEERLQRVLEGSSDGFWDWNIATAELLLSPRWAQMLDYDPAELEPSSRTWERLVHPDDLPRVRAEVQAHLAGATPHFQSEYRMLAKHGEWRWILDRGKVTARDALSQPLRMSGTHNDITERRRLDEALRQSLAESRRHEAQTDALNQMNDMLLYCETCAEVYAIIAQGAAVLFAPYSGALAVNNGSGSGLERVAAWGPSQGVPPTFALHDCWALRRGHPHEVETSRADIDCRHFPAAPPPAYVCVPLNVRGATLGLLHVSATQALTPGQFQALHTLAVTVSKSIKLALSNLGLQAAMRDTSP